MWKCDQCQIRFHSESIQYHLLSNHLSLLLTSTAGSSSKGGYGDPAADLVPKFECTDCFKHFRTVDELIWHCVRTRHRLPSSISPGSSATSSVSNSVNVQITRIFDTLNNCSNLIKFEEEEFSSTERSSCLFPSFASSSNNHEDQLLVSATDSSRENFEMESFISETSSLLTDFGDESISKNDSKRPKDLTDFVDKFGEQSSTQVGGSETMSSEKEKDESLTSFLKNHQEQKTIEFKAAGKGERNSTAVKLELIDDNENESSADETTQKIKPSSSSDHRRKKDRKPEEDRELSSFERFFRNTSLSSESPESKGLLGADHFGTDEEEQLRSIASLFSSDSSRRGAKAKKSREKRVSCPDCPLTFRAEALYKIHRRTHTKERPFGCDVCGKTFGRMGTLSIHIHFHSKIRPIECEECGKRFITKNRLSVHERTHNGQRPYVCKECGKSFAQLFGLKYHKMVHADERNFPCSHCPKRFRKLTDKRTHERLHTGEKPLKCRGSTAAGEAEVDNADGGCNRTFSDERNWRKHMKTCRWLLLKSTKTTAESKTKE